MRRPPPIVLSLVAFLLFAFSSTAVQSDPVTWADFLSTLPTVGVPTTVSLGGGSTVDLTVTIGGQQRPLRAFDLGNVGAAETGLNFTHLVVLAIFNGGGSSTVPIMLQFTNFRPSAGHIRGFIMVGGVNALSSPITLTSSVPGAVQTWMQVGSAFDLSPSETSAITWDPATGTFSTAAPPGNDSKGIVVDVGSLSQYGAITLTLDQHLNDGIDYSMGEEAGCRPELRVEQLLGSTVLSWQEVGPGLTYDLVRGDLPTLRGSGGDFTAALNAISPASDVCMADDTTSGVSDTKPAPEAGGGWFYLVRCDGGTYNSASSSQVGDRDLEIAAATSPCP